LKKKKNCINLKYIFIKHSLRLIILKLQNADSGEPKGARTLSSTILWSGITEDSHDFGVRRKIKKARTIFFLFKNTISLAVFDPGISAGRCANAKIETWGKIPRRS